MASGTIPVVLNTSPSIAVCLYYTVIVTVPYYYDEQGSIYIDEVGNTYHG